MNTGKFILIYKKMKLNNVVQYKVPLSTAVHQATVKI